MVIKNNLVAKKWHGQEKHSATKRTDMKIVAKKYGIGMHLRHKEAPIRRYNQFKIDVQQSQSSQKIYLSLGHLFLSFILLLTITVEEVAKWQVDICELL